MDSKKIIAFAAVMMMAAVPFSCMQDSDASDDEKTYRVVNIAIYSASVVYENTILDKDSIFVMIPDSDNEKKILDFAHDKSAGLSDLKDDRDKVSKGTKVNIYRIAANTSDKISYEEDLGSNNRRTVTVSATKVMGYDHLCFFLDKGAHFTMVAKCSDTMTAVFSLGSQSEVKSGEEFVYDAKANGTLTVSTDKWYSDVTYAASGYVHSDGFGMVLMIVLIAIVAAVAFYTFYSGRATKWK